MRGAVILAGGRGSRIGNNKHLQLLAGKPLMRHVIERAATVADELVVVLKNDDDPRLYENVLSPSVKLVKDKIPSDAPLVGIMTGGRVLKSEYSAFLSCDLPFLNYNVLEFLFKQAEGVDAAIPKWPSGLMEPLHAIYRTNAAARAAETALQSKDYRSIAVANLLNKVRYVNVQELKKYDPALLTFFNVNTTEDLTKAEQLVQKSNSNSS